ncbi:MAG: hypothetical protein MJZ26_12260 [Fibrobacter sp.]|nr:hypothetical protein [Fibrobacter sp.]
MDVFDLVAKLTLDKSGYENDLKEAANESSSFGSKLGSAFKTGAAAVATLTAAGAATVGTITSLAGSTASYGDKIDKMSQKIGISTDAYQEWSFIMEHCGASVDGLQAGMKTLSGVITDAASGSDTAAKKLEAVGLSVEELNGLTQEEQLSKIVSSLQNMGEGAERTSAATDLLGRSATEMAALFNTSAEETEAMRKQVHDLGGVMSKDAVKDAAAYEDALTNLQTAFTGMKNGLLSDMLPGITQVMDGLSAIFSGDSGGVEMIREGIEGLVDNISQAAPALIDTGAQLISMFIDIIIDNLPQIIQLGTDLLIKLVLGIIDALPELVARVPEIITALVTSLKNAAPQLKEAGMTLLSTLGNALITYVPLLISKVPTIITMVKNKFIELLASFKDIGKRIVEGIWQGISGAAGWLKTKIKEWVGNVVDFIKGLFGIHSPSRVMRDQVGKFLALGVGEGFKDEIPGVLSDIQNEIPTAFDVSPTVPIKPSGNGGNVDTTLNNNITITLEGDAARLFKVIRQQNDVFKKSTGQNAFA